jgi:hypothetical protein
VGGFLGRPETKEESKMNVESLGRTCKKIPTLGVDL